MRKFQRKLHILILFFCVAATYALPHQIVSAQAVLPFDLLNLKAQDPSFTIPYDIIKVAEAWDRIKNSMQPLSKVIIGVVDTDFQTNHPELEGVDIGRSPISTEVMNEAHGTAVMGIIGANNISRSGSYTFPHMNGILSGATTNYILGFRKIINFRRDELESALNSLVDGGAGIVNMSLGHVLETALTPEQRSDDRFAGKQIGQTEFGKYANFFNDYFSKRSDILFTVAAGNQNVDVVNHAPGGQANKQNTIAVGATTIVDGRTGGIFGSNFGSGVALVAPGEKVYAPTGFIAPLGLDDYWNPSGRSGRFFGGTSASAPMVTGVAGLIKAIKLNLSPAQIKQILQKSADPITASTTEEIDKKLGSACNDGRPGFRGCRLNAERAACHLLVGLNCVIASSLSPGPQPGPNVGDTVSIPMLSGRIQGIGMEMDVTGVAVAADGTSAIVAESSGELSRVNLQTGQVTTIALVTPNGIASPVIEPGGNTVLVITAPMAGGGASGLKRVNLITGEVTTIIEQGIDRGAALALESGGTTALVTRSEGGLFRINLETGAISVISGIGGLGLAVEAGGQTALIAAGFFGGGITFNCNLVRVDLVTGDFTPIASVCLLGGHPVSVAIESGGETALVATNGQLLVGDSGVIARVNLQTGTVTILSSCQGCSWPHLTMESSGQSALYIGDLNQSIIRFDVIALTQTTLAHSDSPKGVVFVPNGQEAITVAETGNSGRISRIALSTGVVEWLAFPEPVTGGITINLAGTQAFFSTYTGSAGLLKRLDLTTKEVDTIAASPLGMLGLALYPAGTSALVTANDGKSLLRVDFVLGNTTVVTDELLNPVAVAIEGGTSALVAAAGNNGILFRVDLDTGSVIPLVMNFLKVLFSAISPSGLAIEDEGNTVLVAGGGALLRLNLITHSVESIKSLICGMSNGVSGVVIEAGGSTALVSHEVCGILRIRIH
ncbi:MAG: hypothetical protein UX07_C0006G0012 [Parcubacteria group bacterium GW2011_GWA2_45_30]|nr:MAG: hypothetical protein UX07_C0006G0012 [Parcubacteria group bacterium GW2011_GWA2_45_30]